MLKRLSEDELVAGTGSDVLDVRDGATVEVDEKLDGSELEELETLDDREPEDDAVEELIVIRLKELDEDTMNEVPESIRTESLV